MALGNPETGGGVGGGVGGGGGGGAVEASESHGEPEPEPEPEPDSHWVQWHRDYEVPTSRLSVRLRLAQEAIRAAIDETGPRRASGQPIRIVSICAGQGRDVIDVVADLGGIQLESSDLRCLLVELDPALCEFARHRAAKAGVDDVIDVIEGDASLARHYAAHIPVDVVVICGVFGNISPADIHRTIDTMSTWLAPGGSVVWTRHRREPDLTPAVRKWFADAGFEEASFESPDEFVLTVGRHRFPGDAIGGGAKEFDPDAQLFTFVGDGSLPA
jgi:protein-L-isoaspartate O-methyltransferase